MTAQGRITGQKDGAIGWIVFDNPERHNALSHDMRLQLIDLLDAYGRDDDVRVAILCGGGEKSFVSGADISQFDGYANDAARKRAMSDASNRLADSYDLFRKPLIAMIQGYCLGAGVATALNADLRIASERAQFGIPAGRLGVAYPMRSVRRLVEVVGTTHATHMLFTAGRYNAQQALQMGLVSQVVPHGELESTVRALAATIAENAPLTIRASKIAIREATRALAEQDHRAIEESIAACFASEDHAEGRKAFAEKRKPEFRGR